MAYIQKDRVKETTTTNGTGAVTLAGAVAGFQAFSAVMSVADTCYYVIVSATGTDWETGTGTYSSASVLTRTTVLSSSNSGNAVSFTSGTKDVFMGPVAERVTDIAHGGTGATTAAGARTNLGVSTGTVTSVSGAGTVSGLTLTGTVTSSGSLTLGGAISTLNQNTTGSAATVTTNANLTGHVTSVGNAAVLGSFTSAQLATALSDETGTGANVFATSPTLVTPLANNLNAVPVASGAGNSLTIAAGSGVTSGSGGNLILNPGEFATSGTRGTVLIDGLNVGKGKGTNKNTVFGEDALKSITTGDGNVACGYQSLYTNAGGIGNVACGYQSLYTNAGGHDNIGIGTQSLRQNISGSENAAVGYQALLSSTASYNTGIGIYAGRTLTTGSNNTFLGYSAGYNASQLVSATNSMALGNGAFTTASNQVVIGNTSVTQIILNGTATTNALAAIPVTSGLTASVTAASGTVSGPNATITYTAAGHSFTVGRTVTVTGLTIVTGNNLNCAGRTIISVTSTTFTIADFVGSGSTSTATSAVANNATSGGNSFTNTSSNAVTAGPGGNYHFKAGDGVGVGKGGDIEFELGLQGSSGGDGAVSFVHPNGYPIMKYTSAKQFQSQMAGVSYGWEGTNHGLRSSGVGTGYLSLTTNGGNNLLSVNSSTLHTTCAAGPFADTTVRFLLTNNWSTASGGANVSTGHFALSCGLSDGVAIVRNGATAIAGGSFAFPSTTTAIAANTNDLVLTGSAFQRINCTSTSNLTGIAPPSGGTHDDGRMIRVYNVGTANLTLTHNSGLSTTANRYWNSTAADIVLATNDYAELIYDSTSNGSGAAGWRAS